MHLFRLLVAFAYLFCISPSEARALDHEVFDGQIYNGKYYPRMDIIEWGTPSHMEFQVYWKGHPLEMSFQLEKKDGKTVMLVRYVIPERNETLCRRVLAPGHFLENFYVYKDTSDKDMDNTIVSMEKLPPKKGQVLIENPTKYASCDVEKDDAARLPATSNKSAPATTSSSDPEKAPKVNSPSTITKDSAIPFGDW